MGRIEKAASTLRDARDLGETEVSAAKIWRRRRRKEEPAPVSQNQSPSRRTAAMLQR